MAVGMGNSDGRQIATRPWANVGRPASRPPFVLSPAARAATAAVVAAGALVRAGRVDGRALYQQFSAYAGKRPQEPGLVQEFMVKVTSEVKGRGGVLDPLAAYMLQVGLKRHASASAPAP